MESIVCVEIGARFEKRAGAKNAPSAGKLAYPDGVRLPASILPQSHGWGVNDGHMEQRLLKPMSLPSKTMRAPGTGNGAYQRNIFGLSAIQIVALTLVLAASPLLELKTLSSLWAPANSGTWLSLPTGTWILRNHGAPHVGLFSQSTKLTWIDPNCAYDLFAAVAFRLLSLRALVAIAMLSKLGLVLTAFLLAGGMRGRFWLALALSAFSQYLLANVLPGPTACSVVFFAIELYLVSNAFDNGNARPLFLLPPLFFLWVNVDLQFGFGILLLFLFVGALLLKRFLPIDIDGTLPSTTLINLAGLVTAACLLATILNPYGYQPYQVFMAHFTSAANAYLPRAQALGFRQLRDYLLMLLAMAAFLTLGRRRSRDPFKILLLICATAFSFRAQRDLWLIVLVSIWVIGEAFDQRDKVANPPLFCDRRSRRLLFPVAASIILVCGAFFAIPSTDRLTAEIGNAYPVSASNYIRSNALPQPLFNSYEWGGFLAWYLPDYPVAIDERAGFYPDDYLVQYFKAMNAEIPYTAFSPMKDAGTLLLPRHSVMGEALRNVPAFRKAYEDDVAIVLVRR